jgi:hypothetical protein
LITAGLDLNQIQQFIYEGDYFGLFQAIYTSAFLSADIFYVFLSMAIVLPLYIRTKSLTYCALAWILLGSLFIVASPLVSGIAVLLVAMGMASLLYKVVMRVRQ